MLSADDLAALQATQEAALPSTCTITRRSLLPDGQGGYTETWATLAASVACRMSALRNPTEQVVGERFVGKTLWQLTLPAGQDVTHEDRVTVEGLAYEVAGINSGGAWETARRVILARMS